MDCGSLVSITWSGIGNGIDLLGVLVRVMVHVVGEDGVESNWVGRGKRWDASYIHKPIPIIIYHKFTRPSAISTLGDFSLSQNGQPILAQPNFHAPNKSGQCSPKHKLYSDLLVSYDR